MLYFDSFVLVSLLASVIVCILFYAHKNFILRVGL